MSKQQRIGLILTGGGARAAYQVGVLKGLAELVPYRAPLPFKVVCGTSAGALNAVTLAINARYFRKGVRYLLDIWGNARVTDVYRADLVGVLNNSARWLLGLILSMFGSNRMNRVSLLDNTPLRAFLERILPCELIQRQIDNGTLYALGITASGYATGQSVTFYQGAPEIKPWKRARRVGVPTRIEVRHLLASSALPFIFPAVHVNREFFGDGSMRQIAPISSALHLGAKRVLVIGVGQRAADEPNRRPKIDHYPSLAEIAGHALNSIFLDGLEVDLERMQRINQILEYIPEAMRNQLDLYQIDALIITPSQPLEKIAERYVRHLPWTIRVLLRLLGVRRGSDANLVSYLLFEKDYCRALIELGYQDVMLRREEILQFLQQGGTAVCPGRTQ